MPPLIGLLPSSGHPLHGQALQFLLPNISPTSPLLSTPTDYDSPLRNLCQQGSKLDFACHSCCLQPPLHQSELCKFSAENPPGLPQRVLRAPCLYPLGVPPSWAGRAGGLGVPKAQRRVYLAVYTAGWKREVAPLPLPGSLTWWQLVAGG